MENLGAFEEPVGNPNRTKFIVGGVVILAAVVFLMFSGLTSGGQYFYTVDEIFAQGDEAFDRPAKVSGASTGPAIEWFPGPLPEAEMAVEAYVKTPVTP